MARLRKVPLRICVGCQEKKPKKALLRIVRTPDGNVEVDLTGKKSGRGVYICSCKECLLKARKGKRLEKHLKNSIPDRVIDEISEIIDASKEGS